MSLRLRMLRDKPQLLQAKLAERLEMIIDAAELPNASRQAAIAASKLAKKNKRHE